MISSTLARVASRCAGVMKRRSTSPLAQGATVLTVWPPEMTPTLSVMPFFGSLSACSAKVLCASSLIALMPASKFAPECAALPVISKRMNRQPLRPVTAAPMRAAGLGVEADPRRARVLLDHRARERRADLLVAGEQRRHRRRRAAEFLDRGEHEAVHHQAGLHVGDARPIGAVALDLERPARRLAFREHRVAMAHQQDRPVAERRRILADGGGDGVAEFVVRRDLAGDAVLVEKIPDVAADRIDAGLVVGCRCRCSPAFAAAPAWRRAGRRANRGFFVRCH